MNREKGGIERQDEKGMNLIAHYYRISTVPQASDRK